MYKLHANYGRVFSEWSAIEKELGDGLQKSGHYMDSLAATIDSHLEEEELIADQLKEWLFGASALQAVVKRREALQLVKDEASDNLTNAYEQKDKIMQGRFVADMRGKLSENNQDMWIFLQSVEIIYIEILSDLLMRNEKIFSTNLMFFIVIVHRQIRLDVAFIRLCGF